MNQRLLYLPLVLVAAAGCMKPPAQTNAAQTTATVTRQNLEVKVVETGSVDAVQAVEVKSRVSGRLKKLYVDEGSVVKAGQLIAEIDPQETELQLKQNEAQLRGAKSSVARTDVEIAQRKKTVVADYKQAQIRVEQLKAQAEAQPTLTLASVNSAKAALESAKQQVEGLETTTQPNARSADAAALKEAQANYDNAKSEYDRQKNLLSLGYVSQKAVENAELTLEVARLKLATAQDSHNRLEKQLQTELTQAQDSERQAQAEYDKALASRFQDATKRQDYENALADLAKAKTALQDVEAMEQGRAQSQATVDQLANVVADAQRNLGETEIRAPMDGIVTKKETLEGELVTGLSAFTSGTPIVRIEDRRSLRVTMDVNEIDTAKLKDGMKADIDVEAIPGQTFKGTVHRIAPASNNTGATATASTDSVVRYQVEVWLDNTDPRLRSGMSARCTVMVAKKDNVLALPVDFVGKDDQGRFVMIPQGDAKKKLPSKRVAVKTGLETGTSIEMVSGVSEGQVVERPAFTGPARQGFMQMGGDD
ncbi:MAG TPA: efflux RND transporter periplasmic adaptor subunit [Fimbriimonadaceae bacterium]|nr:efflux RND transporter periplasmic adaptor subunit [Fimbriimonadaceae bacterium]